MLGKPVPHAVSGVVQYKGRNLHPKSEAYRLAKDNKQQELDALLDSTEKAAKKRGEVCIANDI